ncbi:hypothetical protein F7D01_00705 [Erythrobacter sp. 3-20A1M]|nr:hypothetical protein F7D01_00705 [Erythrobacter sp. 3-20A1M]
MTPGPRTTLPAFTPVPRAKERSNGWKPEVQRNFIEALAETGSVSEACKRVNRSDHGAYLLRRHPEAESFRAAWNAALDIGMQRVEDTAMDRALNGVEVPVYSYGKLVGTRRVFNDRLLMFLLRNRSPERFAADGARANRGAIGEMERRRLKKQWRAEWEAERDGRSEEEVVASINELIDNMRREDDRAKSPRVRAAEAEVRRLEEEDAANGYLWYEDPENPHYHEWPANQPQADAADQDEALSLPPPGWRRYPEPAKEREDEPRIRRLKDESWA